MLDTDSTPLQLLMASAEIVQHGVIWLNADGHVLGVNEQLAQELGYSKDHFVPRTIFEINPTTSFLSWKKLWKKLLQDRQFTTKTEQLTADNSIYPINMRGVLLNIGEEEVCMAVTENLMASNRYKDLLNITSEIAHIGSWEWDLVQDDFIFSDEMYRLLRISPETTLHKEEVKAIAKKMMTSEDFNHFKNSISAAIQTGEYFEAEYSLKIGSVHATHFFCAKPVWLEDQTIKIYGTLQNLAKISKRTDDLYFTRYCMDHAQDMIFWVDTTGKIIYANQTTCNKLGYTSEELLQKSVLDISPHSTVDYPKHWEELKKVGAIEFESVHQTKDGRELPVSIVANYMNFQGREFNCGFVRDLSAKKKRDEIISMAKATLDQSIDMIFWLRPDASFRYFNDAFVQKSGYSRKEIEQMKVTDFFPKTSLEVFRQDWKKQQSGQTLETVGLEMLLKDGRTIATEMTVSLVKAGDQEYSSALLRDVTQRKRKERELDVHLQTIKKMQADTEAQNIELKEEINAEFNFNNIISRDPNYKKVLRQVEQVADTDATVLILGETGTGKELLARAVHQLSERADQPMIKINCGALPENLIESELFGHEKGAFTGAYQKKIGKFERADKGTIFLDEIGELPLDLQAKLLRVLQEGEIERIGGQELIKLDVRIIAATNRDLEERVAQKLFREDLYYRLNVFPIHNIPLRERPEDIPALVSYFVDKYSKKMNKTITEISVPSLNKLMAYDFLGNVRELENIVERAVILAKRKTLSFDTLLSRKSSNAPSRFKTLEEMQKEHIINALKRTKGKVSGKMGAAELLDMNDKTLASRMRKLGIGKKDYLTT